MTGAQLPLYVTLHAIVMTSFSCTAPEADTLVADIITHKSITDRRRIFKLGGGVAHATCHV